MMKGFVGVVQRASRASGTPVQTCGRRQWSDGGQEQGHNRRGEQSGNIPIVLIAGAAAGGVALAYKLSNEHRMPTALIAESDDLKLVPAESASLGTGKAMQDQEYKTIYATKMKASGEQDAIAYENRIRQYSTPDQTFNYFATYLVSQKSSSGGTLQWVMMTPMDLFNALTPEGAQAQMTGSGNYVAINAKELELEKVQGTLKKSPVSGSLLNKIGEHGLISYNDFCFLLTILSTPRRFISTAFELFDINGDGFLDAKEFSFTNSKLSYNPGGFGDYDITSKQTHEKDNHEEKGSGLMNVLFGKDRRSKMTLQDFSDFIIKLQDEMIELEFREYDKKVTGRITEVDLGNFLLKHAKIPAKLEKKMMKRVRQTWPAEYKNRGVSLPSFRNLYQALAGGEDLQRAMYFLDQGDGVNLEEFQKIFKWVSKQDLSDHVAKVMFVLFDNDMDGKICSEDIQNVLFNWRKARGFEKLAVNATIGHKKKDLM